MPKVYGASVAKWILLCGWFVLFVGGIIHYPGSWLAYAVFSGAFLAMLISGFYRQVTYGYLFLVAMLWLGFWFKLTIHLWVEYPFGESIGLFDKSASAWDKVLHVATAGCLGVMAGRLLYMLVFGQASSMSTTKDRVDSLVPEWYPSTRRWVWGALAAFCIGLAFINTNLGILQIGLVPKTYLVWPLNAVICWLIGYGLALAVATVLWWDISLGRNVSLVVYFVLLEAFSSTVSMLSRGGYIFHVIPQFFALYKNRNLISGWSHRNILAVCLAFIVLFALSNPLVNTLRNFYYSGVPFSGALATSGALARFAVDRWVGAEGVMAVSAYPSKGIDLLINGIIERREIGKDTLYISISRPVYFGVVDKSKFQFSEIPGAIAFLYFSGQLWIVALGMLLFVQVVLISELLVSKFTQNPLLSALWGGAAANAIAQMGIAPRGTLLYFFEMICGIAVICFIQSRYFSKVIKRFGDLKNRS